jgi:hypothetical protein
MTTRGYTILGWLVWQIGLRVAKRKVAQKMAQNRVTLGATGVALAGLGGILAARAARAGGDE